MVINIFRRERESISIEKPDEFLLYLMLAGNSVARGTISD